MAIDLKKLEQKFNALLDDPNFVTDFEQWLEARNVSQNRNNAMLPAVRESVMWFSREMEAKLAINDHKGGWAACDVRWLLKRLNEELEELQNVIMTRQLESGYRSAGEGLSLIDTDNEAIIKEAADVANFAMMIADYYGQQYGR